MLKPYFDNPDRVKKFRELLLSWIGTPYRHMGRVKGRGADCTLFIAECAKEFGIFKKLEYDYYPKDWHLHSDKEYLLEGLERNKKNLADNLLLLEVEDKENLMFGDWLVFSISPRGLSNHSAIYLGNEEFISALNKEGVCIKRLTKSWKKALRHVFRLYEKSESEKGTVAIPLLTGLATAFGVHFLTGLGFGSLWVGLSFVVGSALGSYLFPTYQQPEQKMKPASLSDFSITQANEGQPVPLTYGTVKIAGNIIYYGNLVVEEEKERAGGKGGGDKVTVGYNYYLDVWQAIAYGKVQIIKTYVNEEEKEPTCDYYIFNDGTDDEKPDIGLEFATKLKGVAHIFYKKLHTGGLNQTQVPTIYFVIRKILPDSPIRHANMYNIDGKDYGNNPSAIVYDILVNHCDVPAEMIDIDSFNQCADIFYEKRWGLNFSFTSQKEAKELIPYILSFVDSTLILDSETGKIKMKYLDENESAVAEIKTEDFIDFSLSKPFWGELPNDFRGAYVSPEQDYSLRVPLEVRNLANVYQVNEVREKGIDLTAFEDQEVAFSRVYDIMKRESYPTVFLSIKTTRKFSMLEVGDVVRIINEDYGIDGLFRIVKMVDEELDRNEISFDLAQLRSYDNVFIVPDVPEYPEPTYDLQPLTKIKVFELPYTSEYGYRIPYYWILASKEVGIETGIAVYISSDGTDYEFLTIVPHYAVAGTLVEDYPADTYAIDDERGILFEPYKDFIQFENVSRADLFIPSRVAVIGDEIVLFQYYEPEGESYYRLKGVVRSAGFSKLQDHYAGDEIYIFYTKNMAVPINRTDKFYLKLVPISALGEGSIADATPIEVNPTLKARKPVLPTKVDAKRVSVNEVKVDVFVRTKLYETGAGKSAPSSYTDTYPFEYEGQVIAEIDDERLVFDTPNFSIYGHTEQFNLTIKTKWNGYETDDGITVVVPPASSWFDPAYWSYKRQITVTEQSGNNLTDYQVLIELNSSNFDFSHANSDGSDIRFYDGENVLPHWIEKWDSDNQEAKIWVKVPFIPANGNATFYMYYGNASVPSASNAKEVFIFFDDFEDGNYDGWTYSLYESSDTLTIDSSDPLEGVYSLKLHEGSMHGYVKIWSQFINETDVKLKVRAKQTGYTYLDTGSGMGFVVLFYDSSDSLLKSLVWVVYTTTHPENHGDWTESAPSVQRVEDWNLPDSEVGEKELDVASYKPEGATKIKIKAIIQNVDVGDFWVDLFRVRKSANPEPSISVGDEESST